MYTWKSRNPWSRKINDDLLHSHDQFWDICRRGLQKPQMNWSCKPVYPRFPGYPIYFTKLLSGYNQTWCWSCFGPEATHFFGANHSNLYGFRHSRVLPSPSFVLVSVFMGKFAAMIKVAFNFRVVSWITQRICYINLGVPRICQRTNQNDPFGTESSMDFMDSSCRPHLRSGLSSLSPLWLYTMFKHSQTRYN